MATPRKPLTDIPVSRARGTELSPELRRAIYARAQAGQTYGKIAKAEGLPRSTVSTVVRRASDRGHVRTTPRAGAPKRFSEQDRERLVAAARRRPQWSYQWLRDETGVQLSDQTLRRILHDAQIRHWRYPKHLLRRPAKPAVAGAADKATEADGSKG